MTSDDRDTPRGRDTDGDDEALEDPETPPRDPETGQFLPKDERPDSGSDVDDADRRAEPTDTTGEDDEVAGEHEQDDERATADADDRRSGERDPESMAEDTDSEPTADEMASEQSTDAEASETAPEAATDVAEPERGADGTTQEPVEAPPTGAERATAQRSSTSGPDRSTPTGTVFVTNPNGYPRQPTTFLPSLPWLRLPSRPPSHETVSR